MTRTARSGEAAVGRRFAAAVPHIAELGIAIVATDRGMATLRLPWQDRLIGNADTGFLHGGAITTLVDSACGLAVLLALEGSMPIATLDLRIDYLRPATPRTDLIAHADCYKLTRTIAFVRAEAYHEDDAADANRTVIAHSVATFMLGPGMSGSGMAGSGMAGSGMSGSGEPLPSGRDG